jgi:hypothetical protein
MWTPTPPPEFPWEFLLRVLQVLNAILDLVRFWKSR